MGTKPVGIRQVQASEIQEAKRKNLKIKHIVSAKWDDNTGMVHWEMGPVCTSPSDPLFHVNDVQNALCVQGAGAGAHPTASAVLEDLVRLIYMEAKIPV
jgi:homoserine dehydrogenase